MSWSFTSKIFRIKLIFKNCVYLFYIASWKTVYFRLIILLEEHVDFLNHSLYTVYKFIMHDFIMQYQNIFRFLSAIILFTIGMYFLSMFFHLMIYNCVLYFPISHTVSMMIEFQFLTNNTENVRWKYKGVWTGQNTQIR